MRDGYFPGIEKTLARQQKNLRGYFFGNFYLSSIQQGIQACHVIQQMITNDSYSEFQNSMAAKMLHDWNKYDKTIILLNGGDCEMLEDVKTSLSILAPGFPRGYFVESTGALNGALTCVGVILPEYIYNNADGGTLQDYIASFKLAH